MSGRDIEFLAHILARAGKRELAAIELAGEIENAIPDRRPDYCFHRWKQRRMAETMEMRKPLFSLKRRPRS